MIKLIRDKLADADWPVGPELRHYVRPVRDRDEHVALLRAKLFEEVLELADADTPDETIGELGDVLEVLRTWATLRHIPWSVVEDYAYVKRIQRGGFELGTVWDLRCTG